MWIKLNYEARFEIPRGVFNNIPMFCHTTPWRLVHSYQHSEERATSKLGGTKRRDKYPEDGRSTQRRIAYFKLFVPCIFSTYEMKNQQMSLFQFYSHIDESLHVSGPQAPSSGEFTRLFTQPLVHWLYRSGRVWFERYSQWTNGCVSSCVNSPEDGPVGPKHVEIRRYVNKIKIVTSVGFSFHMSNC
jgi:hypothetical protein